MMIIIFILLYIIIICIDDPLLANKGNNSDIPGMKLSYLLELVTTNELA